MDIYLWKTTLPLGMTSQKFTQEGSFLMEVTACSKQNISAQC